MAEDKTTFHWADYLVFALSLALSLGIGIFFAIKDRNRVSTEEFLMGGRSLHWLPVGLSLLASILNGVFIIGVPAEVHYFGSVYLLVGVAFFAMAVITNIWFVPTFHKMNITSAYEYFDRRYNFKPLRILVSLIFLLAMLFFLAIVLYAPALAFSEVTDMKLYVAILSCGLVCTIYTGFGGMKAVVWTDTIQIIIMVAGLIVLVIKGIYHEDVDGPANVIEIAKENGRWEFGVWDADPRIRHTTWTQTIGQTVIWLAVFATNQMTIQRFLATKSTRHAQYAVSVAVVGSWVLLALVGMLGLTTYAYYKNKCDPMLMNQNAIEKGDQLVPRFLMEILGDLHGLPGLFTAAVFAAALSSVSSAMNSMAAVIVEDYLKPLWGLCCGGEMSMRTATHTARVVAILVGLATVGLSFAAEHMGDQVVEIPPTIWGTIGAPILGCYCLGMFVPWSTGLGSFLGLILSLGLSLWLCIGGVLESNSRTPMLPLGFMCPPTGPKLSPPTINDNELQDFYEISYAWYGVIAFLAQFILGLFFSFVERMCRPNMGKTVESSQMYDCADCCCCGVLCYSQGHSPVCCCRDQFDMDVQDGDGSNEGKPGMELRQRSQQDNGNAVGGVTNLAYTHKPEGSYTYQQKLIPTATARAYNDYTQPQPSRGHGFNRPAHDPGYGRPQIASVIRVNY